MRPSTLIETVTRREHGTSSLICRPLAFDLIPRLTWDRLLAVTAAASPFTRWTVHRAWWDAYGATAHDQYLVAAPYDAPEDVRAIVPLMHRHMTEPEDDATATILRRGNARRGATPVRADAKAVFFGASYHADYATILAQPADLPAAADALAVALAGPPDPAHGSQDWDVIDLRRLRIDDPALTALERSFRAAGRLNGWSVRREREDVCPVVTFPAGGWDDYLATLSKKARHEVRRKLRRAEAAGPLVLRRGAPTPAAIASFVALHRARFGDEGLFPDNEGGRRAQHFVERLAELELAAGADRQFEAVEVLCGDQTLFVALAFDDGSTTYLYNAGIDPAAAELSPGVTGTATYLRDRLEHGRRRFDFLRGNEPYKYEWGAIDEPVERLLITAEPAEESGAAA